MGRYFEIVSILVLTKFSLPNFSIHLKFLPESIILILAKQWFLTE